MLWHYTTGQPDLSNLATVGEVNAAQSTANTALANANAAATTANAANTAAGNAQTAANTANSGLASLISGLAAGTTAVASSALTGQLNPSQVASDLGLTNLGSDIQNVLGIGTAAQAAAIAANTALAELLAANNGQNSSGNSFTDGFNRANSSTLGSNWYQSFVSGNGSTGITSNTAAWQPGTNTGATCINVYTNGQTLTDYQSVTMVLATSNATPYFTNIPDFALMVRCNNTASTHVEARFTSTLLGQTVVQLYNVVSGTATAIGSNYTFNSVAGDMFTLQAGTSGGIRIFNVLQNSNTILTYTDSSAVTQYGSGYRYGGFAQYAAAGGSTQVLPASFSIWTLSDNIAPTVTGTGWYIYRASTSQAAAISVPALTSTSGGGYPPGIVFPGSIFDTILYQTNNITIPALSSSPIITCATPGWYAVSLNYFMGNYLSVGTTLVEQVGFYVYNAAGTLVNRVPGQLGQYNVGGNTNMTISASATLYCPAGGKIAPAAYQPGGGSTVGAFGNTQEGFTFFSGALCAT